MAVDVPSRFGYCANAAEAEFAKSVEAAGKTWLFQPRQFPLPKPFRSYRPDFYVIEDNCFYEVCGTHQAYSYQRRKIEAFRATYPHLRLEVVNGGAWKTGPRQPRKPLVKRAYCATSKRRMRERLALAPTGSFGAELLAFMERHDLFSLVDTARLLGLRYSQLQDARVGQAKAQRRVFARMNAHASLLPAPTLHRAEQSPLAPFTDEQRHDVAPRG